MAYEAAKLWVNRLRDPSVPYQVHLISRSLADWVSMHLGIDFLARTAAAKDSDHQSELAQNMEYTRTVSRTLKLDLDRRPKRYSGPLLDTCEIKRRRGGFTEADEQGDSTRLEVSQVDTGSSGECAKAMRRTISPGPLSKDSRKRVNVS